MRTLKSLLALCLAAVMFCLSFNMTGVANAAVLPPVGGKTVINVMFYADDSYRDIMARCTGEGSVEALREHIKEFERIIEIPYSKNFNIDFNFELTLYSSTFGLSYAAENGEHCLWENLAKPSSQLIVPRWFEDGSGHICPSNNCGHVDVCFQGLDKDGHVSSASRYMEQLLQNLKTSDSTWEDVSIMLIGHDLCYVSEGKHTYIEGISTVSGRTIVLHGCPSLDEKKSDYDNLVKVLDGMVGLFNHEFGHSLGLGHDGHTVNQPCAMTGGFGDIFYIENLWCDDCMTKIDFQHMISQGTGGEL